MQACCDNNILISRGTLLQQPDWVKENTSGTTATFSIALMKVKGIEIENSHDVEMKKGKKKTNNSSQLRHVGNAPRLIKYLDYQIPG